MAIELLQKLPDNPKRLQQELDLQLALGPASIAINGWGAPEVEQAFLRVRELCERMGDPSEISSALFGLYAVYHVRGQLLPTSLRKNFSSGLRATMIKSY